MNIFTTSNTSPLGITLWKWLLWAQSQVARDLRYLLLPLLLLCLVLLLLVFPLLFPCPYSSTFIPTSPTPTQSSFAPTLTSPAPTPLLMFLLPLLLFLLHLLLLTLLLTQATEKIIRYLEKVDAEPEEQDEEETVDFTLFNVSNLENTDFHISSVSRCPRTTRPCWMQDQASTRQVIVSTTGGNFRMWTCQN